MSWPLAFVVIGVCWVPVLVALAVLFVVFMNEKEE